MTQEQRTISQPKEKAFPQRIDDLIKIFIPNFNVRAVLYMTLIFAFVLFMRIWKF